MKMDSDTTLKKSELEYLNFFHSFLLFLSKMFDSILIYEPLPIENSNQLEQNVMTSLSLMWTLHVSIFSTLYLKTTHQKLNLPTFEDNQTTMILPLLQKLKNDIDQYPFLNEIYKVKCENTLEQILCHYHVDPSKIVESNLHAPPPWLSRDYTIFG